MIQTDSILLNQLRCYINDESINAVSSRLEANAQSEKMLGQSMWDKNLTIVNVNVAFKFLSFFDQIVASNQQSLEKK